MKHRDRTPEQVDLLRPRLVDMRHELVKLAALIDWDWFEREWAGFFPSKEGRPATHPRLVAGLMYLQNLHRLSDDAVVAASFVSNSTFASAKLADDPRFSLKLGSPVSSMNTNIQDTCAPAMSDRNP